MALQKIFLVALAWLTLSWPMPLEEGHSFNHTFVVGAHKPGPGCDTPCFPALGFKMPATVPSSLDGWWCDSSTEYAFVGFSYEITQCELDSRASRLSIRPLTFFVCTGQSKDKLSSEFADIRKRFKGRYIRLYGACDRADY